MCPRPTDAPGSNTILVMASSERTCTQLREYLASRDPRRPPDSDGPSQTAGQDMMERLLRSYFFWKGSLGEMTRNFRGGAARPRSDAIGNSTISGTGQGRGGQAAPRGQPAYKRRRVRGGSVVGNVSSSRGHDADVKESGEARDEGLEDEAEDIADLCVAGFPHRCLSLLLELTLAQPASASTRRHSSCLRRTTLASVGHRRWHGRPRQHLPSFASLRWQARRSALCRPHPSAPSRRCPNCSGWLPRRLLWPRASRRARQRPRRSSGPRPRARAPISLTQTALTRSLASSSRRTRSSSGRTRARTRTRSSRSSGRASSSCTTRTRPSSAGSRCVARGVPS